MLQRDNSAYSASIKGDAGGCTCLWNYRLRSWALWELVCNKVVRVQSRLEAGVLFRLVLGLIGGVNRTVQFQKLSAAPASAVINISLEKCCCGKYLLK